MLVRFSKAGDFELTFTKGPGIALLEVRQVLSQQGDFSLIKALYPVAYKPRAPPGGKEHQFQRLVIMPVVAFAVITCVSSRDTTQ